eukprot:467593_1
MANYNAIGTASAQIGAEIGSHPTTQGWYDKHPKACGSLNICVGILIMIGCIASLANGPTESCHSCNNLCCYHDCNDFAYLCNNYGCDECLASCDGSYSCSYYDDGSSDTTFAWIFLFVGIALALFGVCLCNKVCQRNQHKQNTKTTENVEM